MDVIINYTKNNRVKRLSNIEFTEFDMLLKRFYYWEFNGGEKGKSIGLKLVRDIKINHRPPNKAIQAERPSGSTLLGQFVSEYEESIKV